MRGRSRTPLAQLPFVLSIQVSIRSNFPPLPPGQVPLEKSKTSKKLEEAAATLAEAAAQAAMAELEVTRATLMMPKGYGRLESAPVLQSEGGGRPGRVPKARMMPEDYAPPKKPGLFSSLFSSKK